MEIKNYKVFSFEEIVFFSFSHLQATSKMMPPGQEPQPKVSWKVVLGVFIVTCVTFRAVSLLADKPSN